MGLLEFVAIMGLVLSTAAAARQQQQARQQATDARRTAKKQEEVQRQGIVDERLRANERPASVELLPGSAMDWRTGFGDLRLASNRSVVAQDRLTGLNVPSAV